MIATRQLFRVTFISIISASGAASSSLFFFARSRLFARLDSRLFVVVCWFLTFGACKEDCKLIKKTKMKSNLILSAAMSLEKFFIKLLIVDIGPN